MKENRYYPDQPKGPFPKPPRTVADDENREIFIESISWEHEYIENLVDMYTNFDPADRAQGIPPASEEAIRSWIQSLQCGCNIVGWHRDAIIGHGMLIPDVDNEHELAIFISHEYQNAGNGTAILKLLLGYGQQQGIERVWLTVERWNQAAISLYKKVGFETTDVDSFELEMTIKLVQEW
ncbi:MAG: GNAT family N-acetyltransferase [Halobacteriaceae archaeon]